MLQALLSSGLLPPSCQAKIAAEALLRCCDVDPRVQEASVGMLSFVTPSATQRLSSDEHDASGGKGRNRNRRVMTRVPAPGTFNGHHFKAVMNQVNINII